MVLAKSALISFLLLFSAALFAQTNYVVILLDDAGKTDLCYDLGSSYYPSTVSGRLPATSFTPKLDAMAGQGVRFTRFYSQYVCTVSRASLMTGLNPCAFGWQAKNDEADEKEHIPLDMKYLPQYFQEKGYYTAMAGKWHMGAYPMCYGPNARGFQDYVGYLGGSSIGFVRPTSFKNYSQEDNYINVAKWFDSNTLTGGNGYIDSMVLDVALPKITARLNAGIPTFFYYAPKTPHGPIVNPNPADLAWLAAHSYGDIVVNPTTNQQYAANARLNRLSMMIMVDRQIERIRQAYIAAGQLNNTVFIVLSDNGAENDDLSASNIANRSFYGANLDPYYGSKGYVGEGGIRTPGFVYAPTRLSSSNYTFLCSLTDINRTLLGRIGAVPDKSDGSDLWSAWGNNTQVRQSFVAGGLNKNTAGNRTCTTWVGYTNANVLMKVGNGIDLVFQANTNSTSPFLFDPAAKENPANGGNNLYSTQTSLYNTLFQNLLDYETLNCINELPDVPNELWQAKIGFIGPHQHYKN
jgi:arylsulfatase A-like enzyme